MKKYRLLENIGHDNAKIRNKGSKMFLMNPKNERHFRTIKRDPTTRYQWGQASAAFGGAGSGKGPTKNRRRQKFASLGAGSVGTQYLDVSVSCIQGPVPIVN